MSAIVSSLWSMFRKSPLPGDNEENPLELSATPGLMTLLDLAMHRSTEGQLTATICAGHALLRAWLDLKHQAQVVLATANCPAKAETFARACLESASDAIEKLSTDRLASSANLTDAYESGSSSMLSGISEIPEAVADSKLDTGRHIPLLQKSQDCWESARLICIDHVWADDAYLVCQRHVRHLSKQPFCSSKSTDLGDASTWAREAQILLMLVFHDIPMRLYQFRTAVEANGVVSKRLYLVKCEYRAPFRAFLEAHQSVQRAPSITLVDEYLNMRKSSVLLLQKRKQAEASLQSLLETPELIEALSLERECEMMEVSMAESLFPFTELARLIDHKRGKLKAVPGKLKDHDAPEMQELLQRLKCMLCRKAGPETSSGIRPLLLDLQGVPRDESPAKAHQASTGKDAMLARLNTLMEQLKLLGTLCKTRSAFVADKKGDIDVPSAIAKDCSSFDAELFAAQCEDWYDMVQHQHELVANFGDLSERIRRAEMEKGISVASEASLGVVRQRLEHIEADRQTRFEVLKEIVEEVCRREMNWHVKLTAPDKDLILALPSTSVLGVFGPSLQMAGEILPIG